MKKKIIVALIVMSITALTVGCGEKTYEEMVQEATYNGTPEYNTDNYAEEQPKYEGPTKTYFELLEEQQKGIDPMTNPIAETEPYEDGDEYENEWE